MENRIIADSDRILKQLFDSGLTEENIMDMSAEAAMLMLIANKDEIILRVSVSVFKGQLGVFVITNHRFIFLRRNTYGAISFYNARHKEILLLKYKLNNETGSLIIKTLKERFVFEELHLFEVLDIYLLIHELITEAINNEIAADFHSKK